MHSQFSLEMDCYISVLCITNITINTKKELIYNHYKIKDKNYTITIGYKKSI